MWMLALIFIATGTAGVEDHFLLVRPSEWLEFWCDYPQHGYRMRCNATIRCDGATNTSRNVCLEVPSATRRGPPETPPKVHHKQEPPLCKNEIPHVTVTATAGQNFSHLFAFSSGKAVEKVICKGEFQSSSKELDKEKHLSIHERGTHSNISFQMTDLKLEDEDTYWFGVMNASRALDWFFILKITLSVSSVPAVSPSKGPQGTSDEDSSTLRVDGASVPAVSPSKGPQGTSDEDSSTPRVDGGVPLICAAALSGLVLLLLPLLIYRVRSQKKQRRAGGDENGESQASVNNYEEISPMAPPKTIYVTAHFRPPLPRRADDSTEHLYSTVGAPCQ